MAEKSYITHIINKDDSSVHYFEDEDARESINNINTALNSFEVKNVTFDETNFILTITDKNGAAHAYDLPVESLVKNISYDSTNKKISFELYNNNKTELDVADLVDTIADGSIDTTKLTAALNAKLDQIETNKTTLNDTISRVDAVEGDIASLTTETGTIDLSKVVFDNLIVTTGVGNLEVKTYETITLEQLIRNIVCREVAYTVINGTAASISISPSDTKYEIGTSKTITITFGLTKDISTDNPADTDFSKEPTISIKEKKLNVTKDTTTTTKPIELGNDSATEEFIVDGKTLKYEIEYKYDIDNADSVIVYSNIPGEPDGTNLNKYLKDATTVSGLTKKAEKSITGFRNIFYGKSTTTELDNAAIRALTAKEVTDSNITPVAEINDKYIVVALPNSKTPTIQYKNSFGVFDTYSYFTKKTVSVCGAEGRYPIDYSVYFIHTQDQSVFKTKTEFKITYKK